jgi:hypothetical protein
MHWIKATQEACELILLLRRDPRLMLPKIKQE